MSQCAVLLPTMQSRVARQCSMPSVNTIAASNNVASSVMASPFIIDASLISNRDARSSTSAVTSSASSSTSSLSLSPSPSTSTSTSTMWNVASSVDGYAPSIASSTIASRSYRSPRHTKSSQQQHQQQMMSKSLMACLVRDTSYSTASSSFSSSSSPSASSWSTTSLSASASQVGTSARLSRLVSEPSVTHRVPSFGAVNLLNFQLDESSIIDDEHHSFSKTHRRTFSTPRVAARAVAHRFRALAHASSSIPNELGAAHNGPYVRLLVDQLPHPQLPSTSELYTATTALPNSFAPSTASGRALPSLVREAHEGIRKFAPILTDEGDGGAWFLRDRHGAKIGVFKPRGQEPFSESNPKRSLWQRRGSDVGDAVDDNAADLLSADLTDGRGPSCRHHASLQRFLRVGDGALKEVAAYRLDAQHFARVPETLMVDVSHASFAPSSLRRSATATATTAAAAIAHDGSLQRFVPHKCSAEEIGSSRFSVRDVHHIGLLDVLLLNCDRHAGNILVSDANDSNDASGVVDTDNGYDDRGRYRLTPIDHAFCLPSADFLAHTLECSLWFEWMNYPQARLPFSEAVRHYVASLDERALDAELRQLALDPACILTMHLCAYVLKRAVAARRTLYEIGQFVCCGQMSQCYTDAVAAVRSAYGGCNDFEEYASLVYDRFRERVDQFFNC